MTNYKRSKLDEAHGLKHSPHWVEEGVGDADEKLEGRLLPPPLRGREQAHHEAHGAEHSDRRTGESNHGCARHERWGGVRLHAL